MSSTSAALLMRCWGFGDGRPCAVEGQWLESYDAATGESVWTNKPERARRFDNIGEAHEFWRQVFKPRPIRPDGRPNRPLTAFSVTYDKEPRC